MDAFKPQPYQQKIIDLIKAGKALNFIQSPRSLGRWYSLRVIINGGRVSEFTVNGDFISIMRVAHIELPTGKDCDLLIASSTKKGESGKRYKFRPYRRRWVGTELRIYAKSID